ncbi:hypothetical protein L1049_006950 [Liquidambar formosana]|uniref:Uncharacterized protein n=1 Tax=Liquidambar formosana TaxID=63359 RepID=A0AAP0RGH1_LIQFO
MESGKQPLLSTGEGDQAQDEQEDQLRAINTSFASFTADSDDIQPIKGVHDFFREFYVESKKLWYIAGPAIFTSICQYSLGAITQVFAGHVSTIALAAVSVENSVIAGFTMGLMNAEVSVDALSICMNILGWTVMVAMGCNAAISVRVSNELGAAHPRTAKFSVVVTVIESMMIGLLLSIILIIFRKEYPSLFSTSADVKEIVYKLTPLLAFCIFVNNLQPILSGVAIGAGWQYFVAFVNIGCYYLLGVPLGLIMGFVLDWGVEGIWVGMLTGTIVQTCVLVFMVYRTNWNREASIAGDRIRTWGGEDTDAKENDVEK